MKGIQLIEPSALYNLLNQETNYPCLSNPNYLLLLDVRDQKDYRESHVLTAKLAPIDENKKLYLPSEAEPETIQHIVVYDSTTSSLDDSGVKVVSYAETLWKVGSKYPVKILRGGYELFSALYPYLRTQKTMYTPQELDNLFTYPIEVIPGFLFIGNWSQSQNAMVTKDLKIKAHVNVTQKVDEIFKESVNIPGKNNEMVDSLLNVKIKDDMDENIFPFLKKACDFIDTHQTKDEQAVLVFSDRDISRSVTIAIAYFMQYKNCTLQEAWTHLKNCKHNMRPNRSFVLQLSSFEEILLGEKVTDVADPKF